MCVGVLTETGFGVKKRNKKTKVLYRYREEHPLPEYPYRRYSLEEFLEMGWGKESFDINLRSIWFSATYEAHGFVNLDVRHNLQTWELADAILRAEEVRRIRAGKKVKGIPARLLT